MISCFCFSGRDYSSSLLPNENKSSRLIDPILELLAVSFWGGGTFCCEHKAHCRDSSWFYGYDVDEIFAARVDVVDAHRQQIGGSHRSTQRALSRNCLDLPTRCR